MRFLIKGNNMSVKTRADEVIDDMRKEVNNALLAVHKAFTELNIERCWGSEEYTDEFKEKVSIAQADLIKMKHLLGERRYFD
jgi:hypothetical protein